MALLEVQALRECEELQEAMGKRDIVDGEEGGDARDRRDPKENGGLLDSRVLQASTGKTDNRAKTEGQAHQDIQGIEAPREKTVFPELLESREKMGRWGHREVGVQLESLGYQEHGDPRDHEEMLELKDPLDQRVGKVLAAISEVKEKQGDWDWKAKQGNRETMDVRGSREPEVRPGRQADRELKELWVQRANAESREGQALQEQREQEDPMVNQGNQGPQAYRGEVVRMACLVLTDKMDHLDFQDQTDLLGHRVT